MPKSKSIPPESKIGDKRSKGEKKEFLLGVVISNIEPMYLVTVEFENNDIQRIISESISSWRRNFSRSVAFDFCWKTQERCHMTSRI